MVKQSVQQHQEDQSTQINPLSDEKIGADLLLCGWNKTLEIINEAIEHNLRSGVKEPGRFVSFFDTTPMDVKKKKNWLASCINNKTGTPYTLDSLISAQIISEEERQLFGELPLPRRELVSMYRVQSPDKSEWLVRGEMWYGLNRSAGIVSISTSDLDYGRLISVTREFVDKDPSIRGGEQTLVKIIGDSKEWYTADKIYLTPFSKVTVLQALKNAGPPITQKDLHGKISLGLIREGITNPRGIKDKDNDLDIFTNGDFDELFEESSRPATGNTTNINVDPRQLEAFLKYQQEHKQDHQYQ